MSSVSAGPESTSEWLTKFYAACDTRDAAPWINNFFAENATVEFGNYPTVQGRENVKNWVAQQYPYLSLIKHELVDFHEANGSIYHSLIISYAVKDDPENQTIRVRAFGVARREKSEDESVVGGQGIDDEMKVDKFQVWIDRGAVMDRIAKVVGRSDLQ